MGILKAFQIIPWEHGVSELHWQPADSYSAHFEGKMGLLSSENRLIRDIHPVK